MINNIISFLTTNENLIFITIPTIFIIILEYINIVKVWISGIGSSVHPPYRGVYNLRLKQNSQIIAALIFFVTMNLFTIDTLWKLIISLILPVIHLLPTFLSGLYVTEVVKINKCNQNDFEKWFRINQEIPELENKYHKAHKRLNEIFEEHYSKYPYPSNKSVEEMLAYEEAHPEPPEADECRREMDKYYDAWKELPWYICKSEGITFPPEL